MRSSPVEKLPPVAAISVPFRLRLDLEMTLMTARKALVPYREELGPRMISMRSIASTSMIVSVPTDAWS